MKKLNDQMISPKNYRINKFHLFGEDIQIGGMARPDKNLDQDMAMKYLKQKESVDILIGLTENSYEQLATANGIEYHHLPIRDFSKASVDTYDALYHEIGEATKQGKKVTIHCGAGDGRTGTALSSLKLREIMMEAALKDPSILDKPREKNKFIALPFATSNGNCTPFVEEAVMTIRNNRIVNLEEPSDDNGSHSVETQNDLDALMDYEQHLIEQIRKELRIREVMAIEQKEFKTILSKLQDLGRLLPEHKVFLDTIYNQLDDAQKEFFKNKITKESFKEFKLTYNNVFNDVEKRFQSNLKIWNDHLKPVLKIGKEDSLVNIETLVSASSISKSESIKQSIEIPSTTFKDKLSKLKETTNFSAQSDSTFTDHFSTSSTTNQRANKINNLQDDSVKKIHDELKKELALKPIPSKHLSNFLINPSDEHHFLKILSSEQLQIAISSVEKSEIPNKEIIKEALTNKLREKDTGMEKDSERSDHVMK